jgi:hypothetical protein
MKNNKALTSAWDTANPIAVLVLSVNKIRAITMPTSVVIVR